MFFSLQQLWTTDVHCLLNRHNCTEHPLKRPTVGGPFGWVLAHLSLDSIAEQHTNALLCMHAHASLLFAAPDMSTTPSIWSEIHRTTPECIIISTIASGDSGLPGAATGLMS